MPLVIESVDAEKFFFFSMVIFTDNFIDYEFFTEINNLVPEEVLIFIILIFISILYLKLRSI
jgi:hypothetical protein